MAKYKRSILDILDEVVSGMSFPVVIGSVVSEGNLQTLFCCNIYHAQKGFNVTINDLSYKIVAFSHTDESITVKPNFTGAYTILPGVTFFLYNPLFFHGTPITTDTELKKLKDASVKTPMVWLWENFTEQENKDDIIEREVVVELYFLTQPPAKLVQMVNRDIHTECVKPMMRLAECFKAEMQLRSDIFETDFQQYDYENFPKFGVIARNKGATTAIMADNLSGVALYTTFRLFFKDHCECPPAEFGIGSMIVGQNFIVT